MRCWTQLNRQAHFLCFSIFSFKYTPLCYSIARVGSIPCRSPRTPSSPLSTTPMPWFVDVVGNATADFWVTIAGFSVVFLPTSFLKQRIALQSAASLRLPLPWGILSMCTDCVLEARIFLTNCLDSSLSGLSVKLERWENIIYTRLFFVLGSQRWTIFLMFWNFHDFVHHGRRSNKANYAHWYIIKTLTIDLP